MGWSVHNADDMKEKKRLRCRKYSVIPLIEDTCTVPNVLNMAACEIGEKIKTTTLHVAAVYILMIYTWATLLHCPVPFSCSKMSAESSVTSSHACAIHVEVYMMSSPSSGPVATKLAAGRRETLRYLSCRRVTYSHSCPAPERRVPGAESGP